MERQNKILERYKDSKDFFHDYLCDILQRIYREQCVLFALLDYYDDLYKHNIIGFTEYEKETQEINQQLKMITYFIS